MKKFLLLLSLFFSSRILFAQQAPAFWNEIVAFKKLDSAKQPPKNAILFVGSSSFRLWENLESYFPGYNIINRGFGGSTIKDVVRYSYDIIIPYQPKQVVIYCGENDIASGDKPSAEEVVTRFKTLYSIIRQNLPNTTIHFVSMKPSPSRESFFPQMKKANAAIKAFLAKDKKAGFINVWDAMLNANGTPKEEIFREDRLHMKPTGYAIWQKIIQPYLLK